MKGRLIERRERGKRGREGIGKEVESVMKKDYDAGVRKRKRKIVNRY